MFKRQIAVLVLGMVAAVGTASAAEDFYVGGTVGQSKWNDDCKLTVKCDSTGTAYKVFGGYNVNKNFAIEASILSMGKVSAVSSSLNSRSDVKGAGFDIAGVVKHGFTDNLSGFAKLGVARLTTTSDFSAPGMTLKSTDTSTTQAVYGFGLNYSVTKEFALRAEVDSRRVKVGSDKERVNSFSLGAQYTF
ncbi:MAG: outer membrane beta-barrel protein [Undibacterium sp.]|nr:outer membrane beta-barrel protein [Undibacterium sp.]